MNNTQTAGGRRRGCGRWYQSSRKTRTQDAKLFIRLKTEPVTKVYGVVFWFLKGVSDVRAGGASRVTFHILRRFALCRSSTHRQRLPSERCGRSQMWPTATVTDTATSTQHSSLQTQRLGTPPAAPPTLPLAN